MTALEDTTTPPPAGLFPPGATLREKDPATAASRYDFVVVEPIIWRGKFDGAAVQVKTSPDFATDLASVPRFLTWLIPRYGQYTRAAIIHDYLCQQNPGPVDPGASYAAPYGPIDLRDRSDADSVFRELLHLVEVPWARRWLMWSAVTWATVVTVLRTGLLRPKAAPTNWARDYKPALFLLLVVAAVVVGDIFVFGLSWPLWLRIAVIAIGSFAVLAEALVLAGCMALHRWSDRALVFTACVAFTCLSGGLLLTGLLVGLVLLVYLAIEDFPKYKGFRAYFHRRAASAPRQRRIAATAEQVVQAKQGAAGA
jgi:hypothetical protein